MFMIVSLQGRLQLPSQLPSSMLNLPEIVPIETVLAMAKIVPFDTVKTAETSHLHTNSAGSAFSKIQRRLRRRAKPNTSPSTQDESSRIKIRLKDWKTDPANVKVIISDGNAEQPCSEPSLFIKDACKETPQSDQMRKQSNFTMGPQGGLPQRKVRSIVVSNQNQSYSLRLIFDCLTAGTSAVAFTTALVNA